MCAVGYRRERRMFEPRAPCLHSEVRFVHVVVQRRETFRLRVLRPQSLRTTEVGDARVGRYTGAREDRDVGGGPQRGSQRFDDRTVVQLGLPFGTVQSDRAPA